MRLFQWVTDCSLRNRMSPISRQSLASIRSDSYPVASSLTASTIVGSQCYRKCRVIIFPLATAVVAASYISCLSLRILDLPLHVPSRGSGLIGTEYPTTRRHHAQNSEKVNQRIEGDHSSNEQRPLSLRLDWTNITPSLDWTKRILHHQSDCSMPVGNFFYRNRFGLGSDLHIYAQALCNGMESHQRLRTVGNWTWMDVGQCRGSSSSSASPMQCYFSHSEVPCPGDDVQGASTERRLQLHPGGDGLSRNQSTLPRPPLSKPNGNVPEACASLLEEGDGLDMDMFRLATIESLFVRTSPRVQREAQRQLQNVFGHLGSVPEGLITVHVRWGDKVVTYDGKRKRRPEMIKVEIDEYIDAIRGIMNRRWHREQQQRPQATHAATVNNRGPVNVYLATEDPLAVTEFQKALPRGWNLYVDRFLVETLPHRVDEYNGSPKMARALQGRAGLYALGSLLVAMEANDFVLTTASNWSKLMDELRRSILDPHCGNCTSMIDLRKEK